MLDNYIPVIMSICLWAGVAIMVAAAICLVAFITRKSYELVMEIRVGWKHVNNYLKRQDAFERWMKEHADKKGGNHDE